MSEGRGPLGRWSIPIVTLLTAVVLLTVFTRGGSASALRDRHAQPVAQVLMTKVAVTPGGKLFHAPGCRFVHGPAHMVPPLVARAAGFVPCPRCLGILR